jgi:hypothetical protein
MDKISDEQLDALIVFTKCDIEDNPKRGTLHALLSALLELKQVRRCEHDKR